ncbi:hypothetical protein AWRI1631_22780 [Saccharomyces cerevisiae AWRI1631]|uniref:Uncharacterized protein n=1 Tax=Saccharomyces cerevisiae (strain AWRI1631) TaxID=545124 RepID=B5VEF1_YEAS6|nr:hypothetical protein AWRI1631_22780 [Saccharomyces cerevisiae AWRI1631]
MVEKGQRAYSCVGKLQRKKEIKRIPLCRPYKNVYSCYIKYKKLL